VAWCTRTLVQPGNDRLPVTAYSSGAWLMPDLATRSGVKNGIGYVREHQAEAEILRGSSNGEFFSGSRLELWR